MTIGSAQNRLDTATRVAKNSASLFGAAVLTKGAGLIVAVLVARYLGPASLGVYAVVMGLALLFEEVAPLGQRYVVIRELARDRSQLFIYWLNASLVTIVSSLVLGILLVLFVRIADYDPEVLSSAYVVSLYLPLAGLRLISEAVLQGLERMEYQAVSAFVGRVLALLVLWILLQSGVGVVAVFIGLGLYQLVAWLVLAWAILRLGGGLGAIQRLRPDFGLCRITLRASFPFAIQNVSTRALQRVSVVILPMLVTMKAVGMFDAGDRVRQTSAMIIPLVTMAILPTLSRTFVTDREQSVALLEKALKLLLIVILPFVFFVAIAADQIIPLLYGAGYDAAVPVLRIVVWSQVFFVADAVLNQIMVASNNEGPMVRRTVLSLVASVVLTLVLAPRYGAPGVAWAAVLTRMLNLGLDVQFVTRHVLRINLAKAVGKPFLCAALSGGVALALHSQALYVLLILFAASYVALVVVLGVISAEEWLVLRQLPGSMWQREMVRK